MWGKIGEKDWEFNAAFRGNQLTLFKVRNHLKLPLSNISWWLKWIYSLSKLSLLRMGQVCTHWTTCHSCCCEWKRRSLVWVSTCVFNLLALVQSSLPKSLFWKVNAVCDISPYGEDCKCWKHLWGGRQLEWASQVQVCILPVSVTLCWDRAVDQGHPPC